VQHGKTEQGGTMERQIFLEQNAIARRLIDVTPEIFGQKIGLIDKLFGCKHKNVSRPFTRGKVSYRACIECGARTKFETSSFKTVGSFYYAPPVASRP